MFKKFNIDFDAAFGCLCLGICSTSLLVAIIFASLILIFPREMIRDAIHAESIYFVSIFVFLTIVFAISYHLMFDHEAKRIVKEATRKVSVEDF